MCTPGYGITLDRFMRVAHLLPRQRGSVAVDDHTFVNALPWMCRTGAPWTMPSPDEGGLRSGAFAGRPASHRQAVRGEEEIVDAHREDAVLVADGFDHVAYEDDLLEAVVDLEQRGLLLRDLLRCGQLVRGLVRAPMEEASTSTRSSSSCDLRSPLITPYRRGGSSPRV
jgi:hypothetical protein